MASTNKTEHLSLNQWVLTDKPRMDDFNSDNQKLDQAVGEHTADTTLHITSSERNKWNGAPKLAVGTYVGNNALTRTISVGFTPKVLRCLRPGRNAGGSGQRRRRRRGLRRLCLHRHWLPGAQGGGGGFTVTHHQSTPLDSRFLRLNFSGKTYGYVAMG